MARKPDVQYIQFYTDGSAARQIEPKLPKRKKAAAQPRSHHQKRMTIQVDPMAVCGIVVAAVMLALMAVGIVRLGTAQQKQLEMEDYVSSLEEQNEQLQSEYAAGYDLEEVKSAALAIGMVPQEQVQQIPIQVIVPRVEEEPSFWEYVSDFFADLFA